MTLPVESTENKMIETPRDIEEITNMMNIMESVQKHKQNRIRNHLTHSLEDLITDYGQSSLKKPPSFNKSAKLAISMTLVPK